MSGLVEITEAVRVDVFGDIGADRYDEALDALHLFAQATDCPPGGNVIAWFVEKSRQADDLCRTRLDETRALNLNETRHD